MLRWLLLSFLTHCTLEPSKLIDPSNQTPSCVTDSCTNLSCSRVSDGSHYPVIQTGGKKSCLEGNFSPWRCLLLVGREERSLREGLVNVCAYQPHTEGVSVLCLHFLVRIKCTSQCYEEVKVLILSFSPKEVQNSSYG